jgi:hypothetical protein
MTTRKHPPKAVEFYFNEKMPRRPPDRRSRLVSGVSVPNDRLKVERLLCAHHGASAREVQRLGRTAQKVLFRIVTDPADRDHVYRRDAVSALAALGSPDAVMLLGALAASDKEDPVIIGRALNGLAAVGGDTAARLIERSFETHPDEFVRNSAVRALLKMKQRSCIPALMRVAKTHTSRILRDRVRQKLAKWGVAAKGKRVVTRNTGVIQREK